LAERGCRVTALDLNETMLDYARKKAGDMHRITWLHDDMRTFTLPVGPLEARSSTRKSLNESTWKIVVCETD
jgi:hypothetical protein